MKKLRVNIPNREYDIIIGKALLSKAGDLLKEVTDAKSAVVVTDTNVGPLYAQTLVDTLKETGFNTKVITVAAGEQSKCLETLESVYADMLDFGITRGDIVIALGGGVVGDLTGFAASTLLRGIPFIQIPTTLLAQVDSSVGGKVAVNLPKGKNLVGAFYQPQMVIIDTECLKTLKSETLSEGMAEVIKYGAIADKELFEKLERIKDTEELFENIEDIILNCCDIKRRIVEEDEFDTGRRMILNFGHTFGHAIEKKYNFDLFSHGMAVAAGMVMAAEKGEEIEITPVGTKKRIEEILLKYDLPITADIDEKTLKAAIAVDKKGVGSTINLILLNEIGQCEICAIEKSVL